ncbi:hypothetical protein ACERII_21330 [Evansella sp. AB-rgal1]|uniref:hypothetical protein n=1 Tax=Evansella sp. AB-rgal1 TaxID=3242696 RepID=UPI00359E58FF
MQHTIYCNKCNDEFSFYIEDYYPSDELFEIVLRIAVMERDWKQMNDLIYCGSCKPKGAKIYEFKLPTRKID